LLEYGEPAPPCCARSARVARGARERERYVQIRPWPCRNRSIGARR
jgi:hypothetical protein